MTAVLPLLLAGCLGTTPLPPAAPRPNVVLVTLDTTRADHLGAYGGAAATDTLDALAAAGRVYERAWAPAPLTIPSHATLLTGLLPPHHGIRSNGGGVLPSSANTLAERLSQAGWRTGASVAAFVTSRRWGLAQGFDDYRDDVPLRTDDFWHGERPADAVVDDALAWKAAQPGDRPLFLWVHLYDAHAPYRPPEAYAGAPTPYDGELAFVDDQVQRLVDAFAGTPTLFVVVGDHGESLGDHAELTHGLTAYASTLRVPWILAGPGVAAERVAQPVSLADVLPTVLDVLGLPVPGGLDGVIRPAADPPPVYVESWQLAQRFGVAAQLGLVDGPLHLVAVPRPELYDVVADPAEQVDLAAARPADVARLQAALAARGYGPPTTGDGATDPVVGAQLEALGYVQPVARVDVTGPLPDLKDDPDLIPELVEVEKAQTAEDEVTAERVLRSLVARYPAVVEHRSRLVALLARRGRYAEATTELEAASARDPGNPRLAGMRAALLASQGRYADAADAYRDAALSMPYDPRLRAATIGAMRRAGASIPALALGDAWHEQYPDDDRLAGVLGIVHVEAGDAVDGIPLLEQGAQAQTPELEVCLYLAAVAVSQGRLNEGLGLLQREVTAWPGDLVAASAGAKLAMRLERWDVQRDMADRMLAFRPTDPDALHLRALALFNLGRFPEAREAVAAGLRADPRHPDLMLMDANLLAKAGMKDAGRRRFEEARAALEARRAEGRGPASIVDELGVPDVARGRAPDPASLPAWTPPVEPATP